MSVQPTGEVLRNFQVRLGALEEAVRILAEQVCRLTEEYDLADRTNIDGVLSAQEVFDQQEGAKGFGGH